MTYASAITSCVMGAKWVGEQSETGSSCDKGKACGMDTNGICTPCDVFSSPEQQLMSDYCSQEAAKLTFKPVTQPAPFAVGDRVEWDNVQGGKLWGVKHGTVLGVSNGYAWVQLQDALGRFESLPFNVLRRPPAKRVVRQGEYVHVSGSKCWIDEPAGVGHIWTPTGRTHSYTITDETP